MRLIALLLAVVVAVCAFLLSRPRPKPVDVAAVIASVTHPSDALLAPPASAPATGAADDGSEPDEAALRRIVLAEYAAIERAGGMPLTMTATGKSFVAHPKVWSVRKETCRRIATHPVEWECGVALTMTMREGDNEPLPNGERVYAKRGPGGEWIGS